MHVYSAYGTQVNLNGPIARKCGRLLCRSSKRFHAKRPRYYSRTIRTQMCWHYAASALTMIIRHNHSLNCIVCPGKSKAIQVGIELTLVNRVVRNNNGPYFTLRVVTGISG